jgi:hypothetical protein
VAEQLEILGIITATEPGFDTSDPESYQTSDRSDVDEGVFTALLVCRARVVLGQRREMTCPEPFLC